MTIGTHRGRPWASIGTHKNRPAASIGTVNGVSAAAGQVAAYFGNCNSDGTPLSGYAFDFIANYTYYNRDSVISFTCPGTGTRQVSSLGIFAETRGAPHGNVRLAVYDTSLNILFSGDAEILVDSTAQWWSHTSFTGTAEVVGGTNYVIAVTWDSALVNTARTAGAGGSSKYIAADYTGGFPDPIGAGDFDSILHSVRMYVL